MRAGLLNLGLSGLVASQASLSTVGHNIANAQTPGYSRQSTVLNTRPTEVSTDGFFGSGVNVETVEREVNRFVESELRVSTGQLAKSETLVGLTRQLDNLLADPAGGLSPALQDFFNGMHDVAADPASIPARQVLLSEADGLVQRFHSLSDRLEDIDAGVNAQLSDLVNDINVLGENIAKVNIAIVRDTGNFNDHAPNDLLDQRDRLVQELAELVDVATIPQNDGSLNIFIGSGQGLVTGSVATSLSLSANQFDPTQSDVGFGRAGALLDITNFLRGGQIGGLLQYRTEVLGNARSALGHVALGLARTVNEQHAVGQTLTGAAGGNFFAPIDQTAPTVLSHGANTGAPPADIAVTVSDVGTLAQSDYLLERTGATHTLTRLDDGTVFTFTDFPAAAQEVDGLRFNLNSGTIADGDLFLLAPTRFAARAMSLVPTAPEGVAAGAPVRTSASLSNLGDGVISAPVVNLPSNELQIRFDTPPSTFDVTDTTTGATLLTNVAFVSGAAISINGVNTSISGAPAAGDLFAVQNTVTSADAANGGTGTVALASISSPDPNLGAAVTITFTSATTFDVTGAVTGSPTTGVSYVSGDPLSFNGWTVDITGTPRTGDVFTVSANTSGVGDNRNALALAQLQTTETLGGERATYEEVYGQLVVEVGTVTRQAVSNNAARATLHDQLVAEREAISGVNLDEEAAALLRFQQAFQASAKLISVADEIFASLLGAVRG